MSCADQVVAVSHYTASRTKAAFHVHDIAVIHNGIDLKPPFCFENDRHPHRPFRLLYVGNWGSRKGTDLLSPIMKKLGSCYELAYTADRDNKHLEHELPENCHCIGRLKTEEELADAYKNADALLFTSRLEGFGLVVIEAMSCGLPVIAANSSAIPEIMSTHNAGITCDADDIPAFVSAVRRISADTETWKTMSNNTQHVAKCFDHDKTATQYLGIYRSVIRQWELSHSSTGSIS